MSRVGLTPHNYNYLKCWFTLIYDGREVFQYIFTWGFQKPAREIKEALFQLPSYSSSRFRSDFDLSQRRKLEKGDVHPNHFCQPSLELGARSRANMEPNIKQ